MKIKKGHCQCGCGRVTGKATTHGGYKAGQPLRYIHGHQGRMARSARDLQKHVAFLAVRRNKNSMMLKRKSRGSNPERYRVDEDGRIINRGYTFSKIHSPWKSLIHSAQNRAKQKGVPFNLSNDWAKKIWTGKCALSGIPFAKYVYNPRTKNGKGPNKYSASLDRVKPNQGYVKTNCRFILVALNNFKGTGTDLEMVNIARRLTQNMPC